ncbi:MAG: long-chain fatty acid transport protein [Sphingomonadales bacterium]|jgi:long-chain fatty acid transport protein|nr:long-chain fatty acid transport protein [Sphingomonadales bacterium]
MVLGGFASRRGGRALLLFGTALGAGLTAATPARAAGFYLQEQSVRGWGRANSGEVADQGPDSLWWNPAAIGWSDRASASFGATAVFPRGRVEDNGTLIDRPVVPPLPVGGLAVLRNPIQSGVAPHLALALPISHHVALGLAVTAPFNFTTDYDPSGWQRYSAIRTRLTTLDLQPSIAFAPSRAISVGAALNVEYADAWLSNALPNLAPGSPDARLRLTGSGWDLGWSAGVQLRPVPGVSLGLGYKSAIEHKLKGPVDISGLLGPLAARNVNAQTVARFTTPWQLAIGARAGVGARVTLNAQAVRYGWSEFDRIDVAAPLNSAIAENYRDTWSFAFGVDAEAGSRLTLRAGIQTDPTPTRDVSRDARVPDADRIDYNVGASLRLGAHFTLDAAAALTSLRGSAIIRDESFYAGTGAQTDVLTDGRARNQRVLVFALGGRIGL